MQVDSAAQQCIINIICMIASYVTVLCCVRVCVRSNLLFNECSY
jgi:hypothetical protein